MKRFRALLPHIVGWTLLFLLWASIYSQLERTMALAFILSGWCVACCMVTYYTVIYFFVPQLLYKRQYVVLLVGFTLFLIVFGSLYAYVEYFIYLKMLNQQLKWNYVRLIYNCYVQLFYIAAIAGGIKFFRDKYKSEERLERVAKENAQNELKFLKSQMNPHFMFNLLNTIYFQIPSESQVARKTLLSFSGLLRYQLYECNVDKISIYKEINYLQNFVELQRERKKENYQFNLDYSEIKEEFAIPPLIIIPFVENAFKHVSNHKTEKNVVEIRLKGSQSVFELFVKNTRDCFKVQEAAPISGIGLDNVKRRLELLYPGHYDLFITEGAYDYKTELKIYL